MADPMTHELDRAELDHLLARVDEAVRTTAEGFRNGMIMVAGLFFVMAVVYGAAFSAWGIAAFIAAFGAGIVWLGRRAAAKTSPDRMRPVLDALRDAPDRVVFVRSYTTSDSRRVFVTHWFEIKTAEHRLVMKAKRDWEMLGGLLRRRCPKATFKDA